MYRPVQFLLGLYKHIMVLYPTSMMSLLGLVFLINCNKTMDDDIH